LFRLRIEHNVVASLASPMILKAGAKTFPDVRLVEFVTDLASIAARVESDCSHSSQDEQKSRVADLRHRRGAVVGRPRKPCA
jgi:hypothetical protein